MAIRTSEESPIVVLEVNHKKDNTEIVGWYTLDKRNLEKIKKQAKREDGQLLILPSDFAEEVGALSDPTSGSLSGGKGSENFGTTKENGEDLRFREEEEQGEIKRVAIYGKDRRTGETRYVDYSRTGDENMQNLKEREQLWGGRKKNPLQIPLLQMFRPLQTVKAEV